MTGIPEGFHTITPHIVVRGAREAIEFYKKAFGAKEVGCMTGPDGNSVMHAEVRIGSSILWLADEMPVMGCVSPLALNGSPVTLHIYTADVDAMCEQAKSAGAEVKMPPQDMFWGDRYCQVRDPFGHTWSIATRKEELSEEEIKKRAATAFCTDN